MAFETPMLFALVALPMVTIFTALGIWMGVCVVVGLMGLAVVFSFIMGLLANRKYSIRAARTAGARWRWEFNPRFLMKSRARKQEEVDQRWHREQAILSRQRDRANARAQRLFDNLERGVPLESRETYPDAQSPLTAIISLDQLLPQRPALNEVFCLPVIKTAQRTSGPLLRRSQDKNDQYSRLGIFDLDSDELSKLPPSRGMDTFVLV